MKHITKILSLTFVAVLLAGITFAGGFKYKIKATHDGGNVIPSRAFVIIKQNPQHAFLVDVRTRAEHEFVGHPVGAYLIPYKFLKSTLGEKKGKWGYKKFANVNFRKDLLARFNPKTDTLLFMCRSGQRSVSAIKAAMKAGWSKSKVFNILGGFEGDKIRDKNSSYKGQRVLGGWRNEGLPWTYKIEKKFAYQPDLAK